MSLSYYKIVACGTALWKLLDLTVFAQGLLINSSLNDRLCPVQTTHVSDERMTLREESQLYQRGRLVLLLFTESSLLVQRQDLSLVLAGWCQITLPSYSPGALLQPPLLLFLLHQLLAHCHLICSGIVGFLITLAAHFLLTMLALTTLHPEMYERIILLI